MLLFLKSVRNLVTGYIRKSVISGIEGRLRTVGLSVCMWALVEHRECHGPPCSQEQRGH